MANSAHNTKLTGISFEMIAAVTSLTLVLTSLVGGAITIESRYAKAQDVKDWLGQSYAKIVRLRILELELKGESLLPHEKALLSHLKREIRQAGHD